MRWIADNSEVRSYADIRLLGEARFKFFRYVITAAHCVTYADDMSTEGWQRNWKTYDMTMFTVRLGEFDFMTDQETTARNYNVHGISVHPEYIHRERPWVMENDIALLKLDR